MSFSVNNSSHDTPTDPRDIFWKGVVPDFDVYAWLADVVAEIADELSALGQVEVDGELIHADAEEFALGLDLRLAPFPADCRVEARISWRFDGGVVDGETDVQPDHPMEFVREHVLEEVREGLVRLGKA